MTTRLFFVSAIAVAALGAACAVHQTDVPGLSGPSTVAHSVSIALSPSTISQDGVSTSLVTITTTGPNGPESQNVRLDMFVGGQLRDFGTLSARTITTGSNGIGTAIFTAPAAPPPPANQVVNTVSIRASLTGSDALSSTAMSADVKLMPVGLILPPADTPTAQFSVTPLPLTFNSPATFDASSSCGGSVSGGVCNSTSAITSYSWSFGDGGAASGKIVSHSYALSPATSFTVTLTVVNDRGKAASATQTVTVNASGAPSGDWVFSPTDASAPAHIIFNAEAVHAATGHNIVQLSWNFGDVFSTLADNSADGVIVNHTFAAAGSYTVTLSVVDDAGAKTVITHPIIIKP
jgi:chitodextrinase